MLLVIGRSWALFLGLFLLLVGNGLQGTLLGVRSQIEGFSTILSGVIMAAYFAGFLFGVFWASRFIRRVGHIRVFAAMASLASATILVMGLWVSPWGWLFMRLLTGVAFASVYVVVESWINEEATNETRGQLLAVYTIVSVVGLLSGQFLLNVAEPDTLELFLVTSLVVSLSLIPLLLTVAPAPAFDHPSEIKLRDLFHASPVGVVGTFMSGLLIGSYFSYSAVFATDIGLTPAEVSILMALIFAAGGISPWPLGRLSDRMDRRIMISAMMGSSFAITIIAGGLYDVEVLGLNGLLGVYVLAAATAFSLYGLSVAYTNDNLEAEQMVAASAILLLINACGAIIGPIGASLFQEMFGVSGPIFFIAASCLAMFVFTLFRMLQRAAPQIDDRTVYAQSPIRATVVMTSMAQQLSQDVTAEQAEEDEQSERQEREETV